MTAIKSSNGKFTLETYLRKDLKRNVIDHSLRAMINNRGEVEFYIHPSNIDGNTPVFIVVSNMLETIVDG